MKRGPTLRRALAPLLFVAIGAIAALDAAAAVAVKLNPSLSASLAMSPGEAKAVAADLALAQGFPTGKFAFAAGLAREALATSPLEPSALRVLGFEAGQRGATAEARTLMLAAVEESRREHLALVWLVDDAAKQQDVAGALKYFDYALRTRAAVQQMLFPQLLAALKDSRVRREFVRYAHANPLWLSALYRFAIQEERGGSAVIAQAVIDARGMPQTEVFTEIRPQLVENLVANREFALARQVYALSPGAPRALLRSAALSPRSADPRFAGMGWTSVDTPGIGATLSTEGKQTELTVYAGQGYRGTAARKLLYLPPGRYRFAALYAGDEGARAGIAWDMRCTGGANALFDLTGAGSTSKSGDTASFVVLAGCPHQYLTLTAFGPERGDEGARTITAIGLERL